MLQLRSILDVADNTGAKRAAMIGVQGRNQVATQTISAADGGAARVKLRINLDTTLPTAAVGGVTKGKVYPTSPKPTCKSSDALSGVFSCRISVAKSGTRRTATATVTDKGGNVGKASIAYSVRG